MKTVETEQKLTCKLLTVSFREYRDPNLISLTKQTLFALILTITQFIVSESSAQEVCDCDIHRFIGVPFSAEYNSLASQAMRQSTKLET